MFILRWIAAVRRLFAAPAPREQVDELKTVSDPGEYWQIGSPSKVGESGNGQGAVLTVNDAPTTHLRG